MPDAAPFVSRGIVGTDPAAVTRPRFWTSSKVSFRHFTSGSLAVLFLPVTCPGNSGLFPSAFTTVNDDGPCSPVKYCVDPAAATLPQLRKKELARQRRSQKSIVRGVNFPAARRGMPVELIAIRLLQR